MGGLGKRARTEHAGPKRGQGGYGPKRLFDKARRSRKRREIRAEVSSMHDDNGRTGRTPQVRG